MNEEDDRKYSARLFMLGQLSAYVTANTALPNAFPSYPTSFMRKSLIKYFILYYIIN